MVKTGNQSYTTYIQNVTCDNPEKHKSKWRKSGQCVICNLSWHHNLVWNRHRFNPPDEERALLVFANATNKTHRKHKYRVEVRDCWKKSDNDLHGYSCEMFGVEVGESDDPDSYPYWRIILPDPNKSKTIVHLFRYRVCFEPQMAEYPLYLEVRFIDLFSYDISIRGFDHRSPVRESALLRKIEVERNARKRRKLLTEMRKLTRERRHALDRIERARELLFNIGTKSEYTRGAHRIPRIPEAKLMADGCRAAVAVAKQGKKELLIKDLAREMKKDRETVSNAMDYYPNTAAAIYQKFAESKTYASSNRSL